MTTTALNGRNGSGNGLATDPESHSETLPQLARSSVSDASQPSGAPPRSWSWVKGLATSTTMFGAMYLVLYRAARGYYGHLGVTVDQAGVSQQALAGGVLEFSMLYAGVFLPGTLLAVALFRWITRARRMNLEKGLDAKQSVEKAAKAAKAAITLGLLGFLLLWIPPLTLHSVMTVILFGLLGCCLGLGAGGPVVALLYVALVDRQRILGVGGYLTAPIYIGQHAWDWLGSQNNTTAVWARRRGPWAAGAAVMVLLVFLLWGAADLAGGDVLRRGDSTRNIFDVTPLGRLAPPLPVLDLLDVRPVAVSPCLIDLGAQPAPGAKPSPSTHLRAAVIVGHSGGRTYLVGVAGSGGFRGARMGHVVRFSVADAELSAVDLDHRASPWDWDTSQRLVPAIDQMAC